MGERVAILGTPKSGKSTLLRMICGTDYADGGIIDRNSSVSWPLPLSDFMVSSSTVATNIRFIMRVYGRDDEDALKEMAALVEVSEFLNVRLAESPRYVRSRITLALAVGLGFDVCLFDERVTFVDKEFRPRALEIVESLRPNRAIVVATGLFKEVADLCDTAFVLDDGLLLPFADMKEAIDYFKSLLVKDAEKEPEPADAAEEPAEDEFVAEIGI